VFADNGKTYTLNKGAKLLVCATMNPSTYGGVFELNEDLISRWAQIWVEFPTETEEQQIANLNGFVPNTLPYTDDGVQVTTDQIWRLVNETRTGDGLSYALSPRDIVQLLQGYESYLYNVAKTQFKLDKKRVQEINEEGDIMNATDGVGLISAGQYAFRMALNAFVIGKYQDSSEKTTIRARIDSVFGETFNP
jgi:hypothetical protein